MHCPRRRGGWVALAALSWWIAACGAPPHQYHGTFIDPPFPLPDVQGTSSDGSPFSLKDVGGKLAIVFFGYSHCPDVCPMTLARLESLHARLGERAGDVSVVFVSVDPERDTPDQLREYLSSFHGDFYGVHLSQETLAAVIRDWGIVAQRGAPQADADGWYSVDHTGALYVLGPERALQLRFSPEIGVDEMLPDIQALLRAVDASAG